MNLHERKAAADEVIFSNLDPPVTVVDMKPLF